jgi:hypothetical protein
MEAMSVSDIDLRRPHVKRTVKCVDCDYQWSAIYPEYCGDKIELECPKCEVKKPQIMGRIRDTIMLTDIPEERGEPDLKEAMIWVCECGCGSHYLYSNGDCECTKCGKVSNCVECKEIK